jgi:hypothetical protein
MELTEFMAMSQANRYETIWEWGYFLFNRKRDGINTVVFFVNGYFAEMKMRIENGTIVSIMGFSIEAMPDEYHKLLPAENPFFASAVPHSEMLAPLTVAA